VEPHREFVGFYGGNFGPDDRAAFYEAMLKTEAYKNVALINLSSETVTPGWKEPVGLLFLDGDHTYEGVRRDFESWEPHLIVNGLIAFDDSTDPKCGPSRLIGEILNNPTFEVVKTVGKITLIRKKACLTDNFGKYPAVAAEVAPKKVLVVCHELTSAGGLLRFERVGEAWSSQNHQLSFVTLADQPAHRWTSKHRVLPLTQAIEESWDVVMIPGCGFPEASIEKLKVFQKANFGIRVQHILNDTSLRSGFLRVNQLFKPDVVIFNNHHWPVGSFTEFHAERFEFIIGAVNTQQFRPRSKRGEKNPQDTWTVGGMVHKNPGPLIEALNWLPANFKLKMFGPSPATVPQMWQSLIDSGRLDLVGEIHGERLLQFYDEVDVVVMTEERAGWANLVAEAQASGVPVICTPHGTGLIATDGETATLLVRGSAMEIAEKLTLVTRESLLRKKIVESALKNIQQYDWSSYSRKLIAACYREGFEHYFHAPEVGLHGKWNVQERIFGLQPVLTAAKGADILDLGAAEGLIAREFFKHGANSVTGFELSGHRVDLARGVCASWSQAKFFQADIGDWRKFVQTLEEPLKAFYDIVLYLGVHHHLPQTFRKLTMLNAVKLSRGLLAIRTTEVVWASDRIHETVMSHGFRCVSETKDSSTSHPMGPLRIYQRKG
jgi:glycosyltransferase involved in cell wall biosynthesis